jgi:ankyrin repeat protein
MVQRVVIGICVVMVLAAIPFSIRNNSGSARSRLLTAEEAFEQAMDERDFAGMERELPRVNVNGELNGQMTPLMLATVKEDVEVMGWLVEHGAEVNVGDRLGVRALEYAALMGKLEAARFLIEHGARVELRAKSGEVSLTMAAHRECPAMIELLLKGGAAVDVRNGRGETALMIAVEEGNVEDVRVLVRGGADTGAVDGKGRGVKERASGENREEILRVLEERGGVATRQGWME